MNCVSESNLLTDVVPDNVFDWEGDRDPQLLLRHMQRAWSQMPNAGPLRWCAIFVITLPLGQSRIEVT
jgi:hypothetical protein